MRTWRLLAALAVLLLLCVAADRDLRAQPEADTDLTVVRCEGGPDPEAVLETLLEGVPQDVANLTFIGTMDVDDSVAVRNAVAEMVAKFGDTHHMIIQVGPDPNDAASHDFTYIYLRRPESGVLTIAVANADGRIECMFGAASPNDPIRTLLRNTYIADGQFDAAQVARCAAALGRARFGQTDGEVQTGE